MAQRGAGLAVLLCTVTVLLTAGGPRSLLDTMTSAPNDAPLMVLWPGNGATIGNGSLVQFEVQTPHR